VIDAIAKATGVIVAPSNPVISIGPILAVPGIREALRQTAAPVAAISPIIGGKALKGPADRMLASLGYGSSASSVAELYRDFVDVFVLDEQDAELAAVVEGAGVNTLVTQTVMVSPEAKRHLARRVVGVLKTAPETDAR